ncbi:MAG: DNA cytosine methyltransferase [Planctomycetota bacterium]
MSTKKNGLDVFTSISLCSGYEGFGLGLRRAIPNIRTICYVEREAFAAANLVAKIKEGALDDAPVWDDIATFDPMPFKGMVHIIHGGYPCQGFSVAGRRLGIKDPRWLWPYIERIIQSIRPIYCFFENVEGHLTLGFPEVYRSLRLMGYTVEAGLFTASEVGAPHRRKRLFFVAYAGGEQSGGLSGRQRQENPAIRTTGNSDMLADAALADSTRKRQFTNDVSGQGNKFIPDPGAEGLQDAERAEPQIKRQAAFRPTAEFRGWPAGPGQEQYEWEEPRVVDDTAKRAMRTKLKHERQDKKQNNSLAGPDTSRIKTEGQAKSGLGGAVDGPSSRVDRLRLLGNGIVPQQAEYAIRTLLAKV